jgi:hypothetical protein
VCALGLGVAAFAAPMYGSWDTEICFRVQTTDNAVFIDSFYSEIGIGYLVGGWDFGMYMELDETGLTGIYFLADGSLGAFSFYSLLEFDPVNVAFSEWDNAASISLAGVNLYGLFSLENIGGDIGSGWGVGGYGSAGDISVHAEALFNLDSPFYPPIFWIDALGYDGFLSFNTNGYSPYGISRGDMIAVVQTSCAVAFSEFNLYARFPFTCLDLLVTLNFTCANGFEIVCFKIDDIELGQWFYLDDLDICFTVQTKSVVVDFELVLGDTGCFVPYFRIDQEGNNINGIIFDAFTIEYSWNGVTFTAGHLFNYDEYIGFSTTGVLRDSGSVVMYGDVAVDEFFGVTAEGDSCCGGLWSAGVYNFFLTGGSPGIFDWVKTTGDLEFGLASNLSITAGVEFSVDGLDEFCVGFEFTW